MRSRQEIVVVDAPEAIDVWIARYRFGGPALN
jgi:hypothetical protein